MFYNKLLIFLYNYKVPITVIFIIMGILSFIYGISIYNVASGTKFYLIWFLISLIFISLGLCSYYHVFGKIPIIYFKIFTFLLLFCFILFLIVEIIILSHFNMKDKDNLDYIIVLGAQVKKEGPSVVLKHRLDKAYSYLNKNKDTKCILSGGKGVNEPFEESYGMMLYLTEKGIDKSRLILEDKSHNTKENIKNSISIIKDKNKKIGIVTNKFHLYRSVKIAKKLGLKNVCGLGAKSNVYYLPNNLLREFLGVLKDKILGNI